MIDDFADNPSFTTHSELRPSRCVRGRHSFISKITATQVYKAISPDIIQNMTHVFVFRVRNQTELNALLEELSALYDQHVLLKVYKAATVETHSCLYVNLISHDKLDMFYQSFTSVLQAPLPDPATV